MSRLASIRRVGTLFCLLALLALALSGWGLMASYVPSQEEAFSALLHLRRLGGSGAFLRSLHFHLSRALVAAGFLVLLLAYLEGRPHRERAAWWSGLTGYLLVLGLCFTGFLLPMDQFAYWGTQVRLGIVQTVPLAGPALADLLRGGPAFNASTLPRFFALHVSVLPTLLLLALLPLLLPALREGRRPGRLALATGLAALLALYLVAALSPAPLEPRADPTDSEYVPRPEWYFLWLFQLGKYTERAPFLQSLVVPLLGLGYLYLLPWLGETSRRGRLLVAGGWCAAWLSLTGMAVYQNRDLPPRPSHEEAMAAGAVAHFEELCTDCHGEDGRGRGPRSRAFDLETPDFTAKAFWTEHDTAEMRATIRDGKGEDMPAFRRKLGPEEIEALVVYLADRFRPLGSNSAG